MENKDILLITAASCYGVKYTITQLECGTLYLEGKYCDRVMYRGRFTRSDNLLQVVGMMYSEILLLDEKPEKAFTLTVERYTRHHYAPHVMCYIDRLFDENDW